VGKLARGDRQFLKNWKREGRPAGGTRCRHCIGDAAAEEGWQARLHQVVKKKNSSEIHRVILFEPVRGGKWRPRSEGLTRDASEVVSWRQELVRPHG